MEDRDRSDSKWQQRLKALSAHLKSFRKELPPALLLAAILAVAVFVASRPATSIERPWPHFQVLQRSILAISRSTAFRSMAAPLTILAAYGGLYYVFGIRGRRFIVVSDFRVWGSLEKKTPAKGVAGRLQDELMRLLAEMRSQKSGLPAERARAGQSYQSVEQSPQPQMSGGFVPETQVTLQYEGISLEGLHTFFRRKTGREVVITGDLFSHPNGFLVVARSKDLGPWEVLIGSLDSASLGIGLQKLAIRILTDLANGFLPKDANNFVFLQRKAHKLEDYDLVVRLAGLTLQAAPRKYKQLAIQNLAKAHYNRGYWHFEAHRNQEAIADFKKALDNDPKHSDARQMLDQLGTDETGPSVADLFRRAQAIRQENAQASNRDIANQLVREHSGSPFPSTNNLTIPEQDARAPEEDWSAGLPLVLRGIQQQDWKDIAQGIVLSLEQTENYERQRGSPGSGDDWHDRTKGIQSATEKGVGKWMPEDLMKMANRSSPKDDE